MSEEKTRKKIIERCLKRTKFTAAEMEKLMRAYESTVVDNFEDSDSNHAHF